MNQHLQDILDFIQQNEGLSSEQRNTILKSLRDADKDLEITAFKLDRTEKVKKTTAILLEETIAELEQKRKAVEAQNRELEIETALERVRSSALAMKQPADMLEVCKIISQQLNVLNVKEIRNVQTAIFYQDKGTYVNYEYYAKHDKLLITEVDYKNHPLQLAFANQMLQGEGKVFTRSLKERELHDWYEHQKTTNQFADSYLENADSLNYYWHSLGPVALGLSTYLPLTEDETELFKRFRNVFELAYRRFIDIEQAEAQAREAQIELALERVRARTMAMQKSDELVEVIEKIYIEFQQFGFHALAADLMISTPDETGYDIWISGTVGTEGPYRTSGPLLHHPHHLGTMQAWKRGDSHRITELTGGFYTSYFELLLNETSGLSRMSEDRKKSIYGLKDIIHTEVFGKYGCIRVASKEQRTESQLAIQKRFVYVFDQTYTRFLDLQKAEAQAREAQIELGLERVRARAMAMQNSNELAELVSTVFKELTQLDFSLTSCIIWIDNPEQANDVLWVSSSEMNQPAEPYFLKPFHHPFFKSIIHAWKTKDPKCTE